VSVEQQIDQFDFLLNEGYFIISGFIEFYSIKSICPQFSYEFLYPWIFFLTGFQGVYKLTFGIYLDIFFQVSAKMIIH